MASNNFKGLDQFQKDLHKMQQNAKKLNGKKEIPLDELFTTAFMRKHTRYSSLTALLEAGGFHAKTNKEFEAIPEKELDAHIAKCTNFKSWDAMLEAATEQYVVNQLGL